MQEHIKQDVARALAEDLGGLTVSQGDITANLIPQTQTATARIITREPCVVAGIQWATESFRQVDENITLVWAVVDGQSIDAGTTLCEITGPARGILTAERTALNFLQTLFATATTTDAYIKKLEGTGITLLDTRKTLPGMRYAQKYAVTCGGGKNHRIGLYDAFLIKENHIMACGSIASAIEQARTQHPDKPVEVEVENLDELQQAFDANADIVMLDNFSREDVIKGVTMRKGHTKLEVSGNITDLKLAELRDTGIDFVSSGALTKHITAIDLSLRISELGG